MLRFRGLDRRTDPGRPFGSGRTPQHPPEDPLTRLADLARQAAVTLIWLLAATLIALGVAGVVAGMDTPPAPGVERSGRTVHGDVLVDSALDPIEADLRGLSGAVAALGEQGRIILASLPRNETEAVDAAVVAGTQLVADIDARSERVGDALTSVPIVGSRAAAYELSPATVARYAAYAGALPAAEGMEEAWTRLTVGALSASRLSALLAAHDDAVVEAAAEGRKADYARALDHLDEADAAIADARTLRDRLQATVDVTTLDQWLDRSAAYDKALRDLYEAVRDGASTDTIRTLMEREQRAKDRLPPDTRSLVLIMADIGQGGLNDAAIDIEQAHTDLEEALAPPVEDGAP